MRLQKFLRQCGYGSIRKCDLLVQNKKVYINGELITEPTRILCDNDIIECAGDRRHQYSPEQQKHCYFKFNKPVEVLSSRKDEKGGRRIVFDYFKTPELQSFNSRLIYAGRLDYNSRGLMIFTTDGVFANDLIHPSNQHTKEYVVTTKKPLDYRRLEKFSLGTIIAGITYAPFQFFPVTDHSCRIILTEGKTREIRNIIHACGNAVTDLLRIRIGKYTLDDLREGCFEFFSAQMHIALCGFTVS